MDHQLDHDEHNDLIYVTEEGTEDRVRSIFNCASLVPNVAKMLAPLASNILDDQVYLHQSRLNVMQGPKAQGFTWHSDFETWHAEDGMRIPRAITAMVMLDSNLRDNGAMMVIPKSHTMFVGCLGQHSTANWTTSVKDLQTYGTPSTEAIEELQFLLHGNSPQTTSIIGKPGDVLLFDSNLLHASPGNLTTSSRRNAFFCFNALSNILEKPYVADVNGKRLVRPEHFAHRQKCSVVVGSVEPAGSVEAAGLVEPVESVKPAFKNKEVSNVPVFRPPTLDDAVEIHSLVQHCGLDFNSSYLYCLLSTHFEETCRVAIDTSGAIIGALVGYGLPNQDTYFCWQIGVHPKHRGQGIATRLLQNVMESNDQFQYLEATVAPSNDESRRLFSQIGANIKHGNARVEWTKNYFSSSLDVQEDLVRVGPFEKEDETSYDFLVRDLQDVESRGDLKKGGLGKWESRRYITRRDNLGFSFHHTVMYPNQPSFQFYPNHVEAVLIVKGRGTIEIVEKGSPGEFERGAGKVVDLQPGTCYVLRGERHILEATSAEGLHCICVFNPPVDGGEDHDSATGAYPVIDNEGKQHFEYGHELVSKLFQPPEAFKNGSRY